MLKECTFGGKAVVAVGDSHAICLKSLDPTIFVWSYQYHNQSEHEWPFPKYFIAITVSISSLCSLTLNHTVFYSIIPNSIFACYKIPASEKKETWLLKVNVKTRGHFMMMLFHIFMLQVELRIEYQSSLIDWLIEQSSRKTFLATSPVGLVTDKAH